MIRGFLHSMMDGAMNMFRVVSISAIVIGFLVLCTVRVTTILGGIENSYGSELGMTDLRANFEKHKRDFQELVELASEDARLGRVAESYIWLLNENDFAAGDVLDGKRWDSYRGLFKKLGLKEGVLREEMFPGITFLIVEREGTLSSRAERGYIHCAEEASEFCASMSGPPKKEKPFAPTLSSLGGGWYMYERDWN